MEKGPVQIRKDANEWKQKSRKQKLETDPETLLGAERKKQRLSRQRQRKVNPEKLKRDQAKSRLIDSEKKRLKKFRERTMYNAIFPCSCCQRNLFDSNVSRFDEKLITNIETKKPGLFKRVIEYLIKMNINGKIASCMSCL